MERILTDQSGKKNPERIRRYFKFFGVQTSFFFFVSLKIFAVPRQYTILFFDRNITQTDKVILAIVFHNNSQFP
jgi:hypothetical protein